MKVGDRVRLRGGSTPGTVTDVLPGAGREIRVDWDYGSRSWHREADLTPVAEPVATPDRDADAKAWTLDVTLTSPDGEQWSARRRIPPDQMDAARQPRCMTREQFRELVSQVLVSWGRRGNPMRDRRG